MLVSADTYEGIHTCSGHKNRRSGRNLSVYERTNPKLNDVYGSSRVQTYVCLCTAETRGVETSHYNISTKNRRQTESKVTGRKQKTR